MTDTTTDQLPDEPTGTTIDGTPWEEARPPHLPDTVTGLPVPTILFTLGAIGIGILTIRDRPPRRGRRIPAAPSSWVLSLSVPIVSFLIPAVFFLRHRDAWSAHRAMALGTTLFALSRAVGPAQHLSRGLVPLDPPERRPRDQPVVDRDAGRRSRRSPSSPSSTWPAGSIEARLYADRPGTRRWWVLIGLVAAASRGDGAPALRHDLPRPRGRRVRQLLLAGDAQRRRSTSSPWPRGRISTGNGRRRTPSGRGPELRLVPGGLRGVLHPRDLRRLGAGDRLEHRGLDEHVDERPGAAHGAPGDRLPRAARRVRGRACRRRTRPSTRPRPRTTTSPDPTTRPRRPRPPTTWRARPPRPGPPAATPRGCAAGSGPRRPIRPARTGRASGSTAGRRARRPVSWPHGSSSGRPAAIEAARL